MDEAYVVMVWCNGVVASFPFATKGGAEAAVRWLYDFPGVKCLIIDDHERDDGEG